jgi:hypothetical protein
MPALLMWGIFIALQVARSKKQNATEIYYKPVTLKRNSLNDLLGRKITN